MAKQLLIILFVIAHQFLFGQSIDSVNVIIIDYSKGQYSFGRPGVYGKGEILELSRIQSGDFKFTHRFSTVASAGNDGKSLHTDSIRFSTKNLAIVPREKIYYWLTQLNTDKQNFTPSFIGPRLAAPERKEIVQVAKKNDELWKLRGFDSDKEDSRKKIEEMQSFKMLDTFLASQKTTMNHEAVSTDAYNNLKIITISGSDTTEYRCQFFDSPGQPISRFKNRSRSMVSTIVNLEANTAAQDFLPKHSMIYRVLDINSIKEDYIDWYLDKKM
ncbi:hypothetical protein [Pinibacter soli]|uniref:DUF4369 domain-containing protein n=1 Tax=Pinibacter soli TaxID=3044211 RepID=A0ABT6RF89_9BACT|nr:hypothetical protein [Pinibacter soli]MDI3321205.1 hypothetical protein [Pinibacter soli]